MKLLLWLVLLVICIAIVTSWTSHVFHTKTTISRRRTSSEAESPSSTALQFAKKRKGIFSKRINDPVKTIPRRIKLALNKITPYSFAELASGDVPVDHLKVFLKYNNTEGLRENMFRRLQKTARMLHLLPFPRNPTDQFPILADALRTAGNYSLFLQAINIAELNDLVTQKNITALIPADVPFQEYLDKELQTTPEEFFTDKEKVRSLVKQHILPGYITVKKFRRFINRPLLSYEKGKEIKLSEAKDDHNKPIFKFQDANVLKLNWKVFNGVIHVIDKLFINS